MRPRGVLGWLNPNRSLRSTILLGPWCFALGGFEPEFWKRPYCCGSNDRGAPGRSWGAEGEPGGCDPALGMASFITRCFHISERWTWLYDVGPMGRPPHAPLGIMPEDRYAGGIVVCLL